MSSFTAERKRRLARLRSTAFLKTLVEMMKPILAGDSAGFGHSLDG